MGIAFWGGGAGLSNTGSLVISSTPISGGTDKRVLYDNAGVVGEYAISGSGSVAMTTSPTFVTPTLGAATGTSLALGGATIGSNALAVTGTGSISGQFLSSLTYNRATPQFGTANTGFSSDGTSANISANGTSMIKVSQGLVTIGTHTVGGPALGFLFNNADATSPDLYITRGGAAVLQLGAVDAAAPVAQTLRVQSVVAGTSNTAGTDFSIYGSKSTGSGAGGAIKFYTSPAGSSGTAQNAGVLALTIDSTGSASFKTGSATTTSINFGTANTGLYSRSGAFINIVSGGTVVADFTSGTTQLGGTLAFGASSGTGLQTGAIAFATTGIMTLRGSSATNPALAEFYTYDASPPAAGAASTARLYADTSGGKIRLMAIFPSGAAQQIAIEP